MKYWSVIFSKLPAHAMALYPFMLFKYEGLKYDEVIVRHEKIHFRQQLELLIIPFYVIYLLHYLLNLLKYKNRSQAYFNICFEREAYANDRNVNYLKTRSAYAWCRGFRHHPLKRFLTLGLFVFGVLYHTGVLATDVQSHLEIPSKKTTTKPSEANVSLNVMTFNILWDKVTKGPTQWTFRKTSAANLIRRHHPDIIGVQEGFVSQMNFFKSETGLEYFGWGTDDGKSHLDNPGQRQSLNPIMYDAKRLTVLEKGVFWYADQSDAPGIFAGEDRHFRNCVWGKFKERGAKGRIFYVFNTHFSLKDDMRRLQAILLKTKIKEIAGEAAEVIVTGDFNSDPIRDLSYGILTDTKSELTLVDSKKICSSPATGPSFSGSGLMVNSRTKGTEIDHIFVRNISSSTAYKVIDDHEGEVYPSDHFPVLSVLKFGD